MVHQIYVISLLVLFNSISLAQSTYQVKKAHPRLFIEDVHELSVRCDGPLAEDYQIVKQRADNAVKAGRIRALSNQWSIPEDLMNCGIAYLVEREKGHDAQLRVGPYRYYV